MSGNQHFQQPDGTRIGYKVLGSENLEDKVPLVMIAGTWCTKEDFMDLEDELAKKRRVILIDNRGMGESSIVSSDVITIDLMAQDTIALINHLGIKHFSLLGWSMGAHIALCIALSLPSDLKLEKLVLCSCPKQFETSSFLVKLSQITESDVPTSVQGHKDWLMRALEKCTTDYFLAHPEKLDKLAELKFKTNRPLELLKRQWGAMEHKTFGSELQAVKVPTMVIHGEDDEVVAIQEGELLAREIPGSKFVKVPHSGNRFWFTGPQTMGTISDFLIKVA